MAVDEHAKAGFILTNQDIKTTHSTTGTLGSDTQVKVKRKYTDRKHYAESYKLKMLAAYDACTNAQERGALLRKEGLYHSRIWDWKKQLEKGNLKASSKPSTALRSDHLATENEQLKKKLAHAEAIIELQKKISELLGATIPLAEINEKKS